MMSAARIYRIYCYYYYTSGVKKIVNCFKVFFTVSNQCSYISLR